MNLKEKISELWEKIVFLFKKEEARPVAPKPPRKHLEKRKLIAERRGYTGETYRQYVEEGITPLTLREFDNQNEHKS